MIQQLRYHVNSLPRCMPGSVHQHIVRFLLTTLLIIPWFTSSAQYTPETVPNIKLENNSYVSNPDTIISSATVAQIDTILADVERKTSAQVAVVILSSIGDTDDFEFSQALFQRWGIGQSSNNNGLLILFVGDRHIIRFHTGYGTESVLPDALCKQIQRNSMLPEFKQGNIDNGILYGVQEVSKVLTDPNYAAELTAVEDEGMSDYSAFVLIGLIFFVPVFLITWAVKSDQFANSKPAAKTDFPQMRLNRGWWLVEFGLVPIVIMMGFWLGPSQDAVWHAMVALYFYFMATVLHRVWRERKMINGFIAKRKFFEITDYLRHSTGYWFFIALVFPAPFVAYFPFHFVRKKSYRNHPRKCKECDGDMVKLSETDDDKYLTKNQIVEEKIDSVNYDVWQCKSCQATEEWHFATRFTKYTICPACKSVAYYCQSSNTKVTPTYTRSGSGEQVHVCKACNKTVKSKYSIAMLTPSSSSSSSSSSYSSGGSSGGSAGGSWGGGSSGGGGASSSW